MWRGILQSFTVTWLSLKVFQRGGSKQHKHVYSCFLLLVPDWPWYSIKQWLTLITHNTNRHCRAPFNTFVGPLSKQLYNGTLIFDQNQNTCESKVNAKTRIKSTQSVRSAQFAWSAFWVTAHSVFTFSRFAPTELLEEARQASEGNWERGTERAKQSFRPLQSEVETKGSWYNDTRLNSLFEITIYYRTKTIERAK